MATVRPVSERQARTMLMGMTMLPVPCLFLASFVVSFTFAWRSWWSRPAWFWRPFTAASLAMAVSAVISWTVLFGYPAIIFGMEPVDPNVSRDEQFMAFLIFIVGCYIAWSIAMLPHTLARIVMLLLERKETTLARH